jgi:hypothetical protein
MGPSERPRRERARSNSGCGPGGLRQGQPLSSADLGEAAAPDPGAVASLLSHHHGYLSFTGGNHLSTTLTSAFAFASDWQSLLTTHNSRLYAVPSPPRVAAAFVLQHLLSIPAQLAAFVALAGPWQVDLGTLDDARISCDLAPGLYPQRLGFLSVGPADADLETRLDGARTAYRSLGRAIAKDYPSRVRMSSQQRLGMVEDLWEMALREARASIAGEVAPAVERQSCCFIYALPGCHECAGCPRTPATG